MLSSMETADDHKRYTSGIREELKPLLEVAYSARAEGLDPASEPEPKIAFDLAERVEGLVGPPGVAERIRELNGKIESREQVALKIAEEIVYGKFTRMEESQSAEQAVKTALAILTEGVTAAPVQGISKVAIKENPDGTKYIAIYFAGPIRSAGGTEQALTLIVGDFVRRLLGLDRYKPTDDEIRRFVEEARLYEREVSRFQFKISDRELEDALLNLPIEVTGTETDRVEVSSFRNLPRIETNRVRGGALRVVNDGVVGRSQKVWKIVEELGVEGWGWLGRIRRTSNEEHEAKEFMYTEDVLAGRPVFCFPSRRGGFRLRYGRARNTGLAAVGVHPATMTVLQGFIARGTQLRVEKPGKAAVAMPVDSIEAPVVKLKNGDVTRVETVEEAEDLRERVEKVLFLGDMLVGFGEFLENNKPLMPAGFSEEWWREIVWARVNQRYGGRLHEAAGAIGIPARRFEEILHRCLVTRPDVGEAMMITKEMDVPLHPRYTYFWEDLTVDQLITLRKTLLRAERAYDRGSVTEIRAFGEAELKAILEAACIPHRVVEDKIVIEKEDAAALSFTLQLEEPKRRVKRGTDTLETLRGLCGADIRKRGLCYIGARMGRPEKAKPRKMSPPVHVLFPVGLAGGAGRDIVEATSKGVLTVELVQRQCPKCGQDTHRAVCPTCTVETALKTVCPNCGRTLEGQLCPACKVEGRAYRRREVPIKEIFDRACRAVNFFPDDKVKGVRGLTSRNRIPEPIEKGLLRSKHDLFIYKDGTIRFDATNAPLTHFKPSEVDVSMDVLRRLGYTHDLEGAPLTKPGQVCELKVQDVIVPKRCGDYLVRVACFLDELLDKVYSLQPYYRISKREDLAGHLIVGLAPHTSVGVIGRIGGFTDGNVCYAHPLWHAAKRRDCDGDEDAIILALDVLLNFSKQYLPEQIGGMMDAPLLITPVVNPKEVDEEAHNVDVTAFYPLIFYEEAASGSEPKRLKDVVETIGIRLDTPMQCQAFGFTQPVSDINLGVLESAYKSLGPMITKMDRQLALAEKIRAVDVKEVALRVLTSHLMRDIAGNLKAFTTQSFRCKRCNNKYRRMPLQGKCLRCGGELSLTVHRGGIEKYLSEAERLARRYELEYYTQRLALIEDEISLVFGTPRAKQVSLGDFV